MTNSLWDAPNQQVVRDDHSAPWEEGTGGGPGPVEEETTTDQPAPAPKA